jgi:hypothetical protein
VQLIRCTITRKVVKHKRTTVEKCVGKLVSGPITFKTKGTIRVSLRTAGGTVATGTYSRRRLVLRARRVLTPGRYRLTLRRGTGSQSLQIVIS